MMDDELNQPGSGDSTDNIQMRDGEYGMTELMVLAGLNPQTDTLEAAPALTTFGEVMQALDTVPGQSQMLQVTSRQGSSAIRLGPGNS